MELASRLPRGLSFERVEGLRAAQALLTADLEAVQDQELVLLGEQIVRRLEEHLRTCPHAPARR